MADSGWGLAEKLVKKDQAVCRDHYTGDIRHVGKELISGKKPTS